MKTNYTNFLLPLCIAVVISTAVPAEAMQSEFPQEMRQGLLIANDAAENRAPQRSRWWSKAGWRDTINRLKNNQFVKSLTEIAVATSISEGFCYSITQTNSSYFFLRDAFAIMCAPPVATNLQLTPRLLHRLSNYPKIRALLSQLIKHGICIAIWAGPPLLFNTEAEGSKDPIGSFFIQYLTAELLVLALDMGILTNPPRSETSTHPNGKATTNRPEEAQASLALPSQPDDIENCKTVEQRNNNG